MMVLWSTCLKLKENDDEFSSKANKTPKYELVKSLNFYRYIVS